jgi:hypothetical protein
MIRLSIFIVDGDSSTLTDGSACLNINNNHVKRYRSINFNNTSCDNDDRNDDCNDKEIGGSVRTSKVFIILYYTTICVTFIINSILFTIIVPSVEINNNLHSASTNIWST